MRKTLIIFSVIICVALQMFLVIKFDIPEKILYYFCQQVSREMVTDIAKEYDAEIICFWQDGFFSVSEYNDSKNLSFLISAEKTGSCSFENIFSGISKYKKFKGKFYVIAEEGYAVIDKNNICRTYIIEECESYRRDKRIEDELVVYLESKGDFSKEELKVFEEMES